MAKLDDIVTSPATLDSLSDIGTLHRGLIAVAFFGFLSFLTSVALFVRLAWRLITWSRKNKNEFSGGARINQFTILLFNLVFADIQQSIAFLLNAHWLAQNSIEAGTAACWAQGWFVSTGDLGSGLFTLAIALHAFADILFDFRLGHKMFLTVIGALWIFDYACAIIGIAMHPADFYERAGAWCWINAKYDNERIWLHYFWVIIAEFGTVIIYALVWLILRRRVKESFYTTPDTAIRAKSAAKMIIAYPVVYVVCTLPIVKARLTSIAGGSVSFVELCVAGAMITSCGWIDVLLYTLTRRDLFSGSTPPDDKAGVLNTFRFRPDQIYGTTTTIEGPGIGRTQSRRRTQQTSRDLKGYRNQSGSTEELCSPPFRNVKAETTVVVRTDTIELQPSPRHDEVEFSRRRPSVESRSQKSVNQGWKV